jgi:hypothetical protein
MMHFGKISSSLAYCHKKLYTIWPWRACNGQPLRPSLSFASEAGAYPSEVPL